MGNNTKKDNFTRPDSVSTNCNCKQGCLMPAYFRGCEKTRGIPFEAGSSLKRNRGYSEGGVLAEHSSMQKPATFKIMPTKLDVLTLFVCKLQNIHLIMTAMWDCSNRNRIIIILATQKQKTSRPVPPNTKLNVGLYSIKDLNIAWKEYAVKIRVGLEDSSQR